MKETIVNKVKNFLNSENHLLIHVSHNDLDGFACQYLTENLTKNRMLFNIPTGADNICKFLESLEELIETDVCFRNKKVLALFTDLNLDDEVYFEIEASNFFNSVGCDIIWLDHHVTNESFKDDWIYINKDMCATKITSLLVEKLKPLTIKGELSDIVEAVNAYDVWIENHRLFEMGKLLSDVVYGTIGLSSELYGELRNNLVFKILDRAKDYIKKENGHIALDKEIYNIKYEFFYLDKDDTLSNLKNAYVTEELINNIEKCYIKHGKYTGVLLTNIDDISYVGNAILKHDPLIEFVINIKSNKTLSFRGRGNLDLSEFARYYFNGGGHKCASGGFFRDFEYSFVYKNNKRQIVEHLREMF